MSDLDSTEKRGLPRWNWRVAGMIVLLMVGIGGAVILADIFAVRDRSAGTQAAGTRPGN